MKNILIFFTIILFSSTLVFAQNTDSHSTSRQSTKNTKTAVKDDESRISDIDPEGALDKRQKAATTTSNVSRSAHDNAKNVIRNMR